MLGGQQFNQQSYLGGLLLTLTGNKQTNVLEVLKAQELHHQVFTLSYPCEVALEFVSEYLSPIMRLISLSFDKEKFFVIF